jgi:diguanylate cyclase (GGDEF)-like protein
MEQQAETGKQGVSALSSDARAQDALAQRSFWRGLLGVLVFNGLLLAWLLVKPCHPALHKIVDNLAQALGPLLVALWCFLGAGRRRHGAALGAGARRRAAPSGTAILLGLGALGYSAGQGIWTYYEYVLHREVPVPSWADLAFLSAYPFLLLGILRLPARPLPLVTRTRIVLDGLITMTGLLTFSWRFLLGPIVLDVQASLLDKIVGAIYPLMDLVLIFCLLVLSARSGSGALRRTTTLLSLGLVCIVIVDTIFGYQALQETYVTGTWIDALWPLGYMLVGLASCWLSRTPAAAPEAGTSWADTAAVQEQAPLLWRSLLPYALMPAVGALLLYTVSHPGDPRLKGGVYTGCALLVALVLLRQVLAILENRRLYRLVREANHALEAKNQKTQEYARSLEQLNAALHQSHAALRQEMAERARAEGALQRAHEELERRVQERTAQLAEINQALQAEIAERRQAQEQLAHQAFHDSLTGLPNRALFLDRLQRALAQARRAKDPVAVLFLDLDNFKVINDSLGHETGDGMLIAIAQRLRACVRPGDTVARLGGDEFTILLEDVDDACRVARVAERVAAALRAPLVIGGREVFTTASIGIAISTGGDEMPGDLLRDADTAMYQAKTGGKAGYAVFDRSMNTRALERLEIESDLRQALEQGELRLHFQPIVQLESGQLTEVEALVRWEHPKLGLVPPGRFIPVAEETGLIVPLGAWVLQEACRQGQAWQGQRPGDPPLVVSVNLSARQLQQADLVDMTARILEETGFDPARLKLEITESVMMLDAESTIGKLHQLKALGVHLAVDDFGTGYSSMAYLSSLPIDTLKIDRSFVSRLGQQTEAEAIVRAIISLAKTLNLQVTSEGIETPEQLAHLQALGCERGQGYYFARPLTGDAVAAWFTAPRPGCRRLEVVHAVPRETGRAQPGRAA